MELKAKEKKEGVTVSTRLTLSEASKLEAIADKAGVSKSEAVRQILIDFLKRGGK